MNKHFFSLSFGLGALALIWVASGFLGSHWLALAMTLLIAAVYAFGAWELRAFRQTTAALAAALQAVPAPLTQLEDWLERVPAALQNPVRLRIEGERVGLPGPALTPYLVGLLVMLGMLGTFLGMVATLNGAVFALEGTADLAAIRTAFAAPIKGLGLAFGTSVAGVASSAMLGLMSALSRRERLLIAQVLDSTIASSLRGFSHSYQRQQAYQALQTQAQALPAVVATLQALMQQMERMGQQTHERLLSNQEGFHTHMQGVYTGLARSVDQSLRDSLTQSAQAAGNTLRPVLQEALGGMAKSWASAQATLQATQAEADQQRLQAWRTSLEGMAAGLQAAWQDTGAQAQASARTTLTEITRLLASSEALVQARISTESAWTLQHGQRMEQLTTLLRHELGALKDAEAQRGDAAVQRLGALQADVATHLVRLGTALEAPIARLIETASEAPRAAAEVIGQLRKEVSTSTARDNALLEERARILETLNTLLAGIQHASTEQRAVIDTLVASTATALGQAGGQFSAKVEVEAAKLAEIAAQVSSSAVEVSSLGETLGFAVRAFGDTNDKLVASLQRVEGALDKSMARSDDQLAYYVAQAREVIDLSIGSQKDIVDGLRQLAARQAQLAGVA